MTKYSIADNIRAVSVSSWPVGPRATEANQQITSAFIEMYFSRATEMVLDGPDGVRRTITATPLVGTYEADGRFYAVPIPQPKEPRS